MREETKLKGGDEIVRHTKIREDGVNILFKKFTIETKERDRSVVRRRIGRRGICTVKEDFQSRGTRPVEMERLNLWQSGEAIGAEVALSIQDEMLSGPEAVLDGSCKIRQRMPFSVQRSSSGEGRRGWPIFYKRQEELS